MHSWPIMVESMSARNSRLRRRAAGCTTTSIGARRARRAGASATLLVEVAAGVKEMSAAMPGSSHFGSPAALGKPRARARATRHRARVRRDRRSGSRHESCDAGPSTRCAATRAAYCRPDRERQVGAGAGAGRAPRRRRHQCRFHAGLSRPARHHRAAELRRRRARRTGSTATSMRRRTIRSGAGAATCARRWRTRRAGRVPILVGGTGLYFKALTQGLVGGAADRRPKCATAVRGALREEGVAPLTRNLPGAIRRRRARLMPADRSRIAARWRCSATGRSLADWHREGMPAMLDPQHALKMFLDVDREELRTPDRRALRRHAGGRRAGRGEGAGRAQARSAAAGDEGPRRAVADPASAGEIALEEAVERAKHGYPALRQAAGHLVPQPDAGLVLGLVPP